MTMVGWSQQRKITDKAKQSRSPNRKQVTAIQKAGQSYRHRRIGNCWMGAKQARENVMTGKVGHRTLSPRQDKVQIGMGIDRLG